MRDTPLAALHHDLQLLIEPIGLRRDRWLVLLGALLGAALLSFSLSRPPIELEREASKAEVIQAVAVLEPLPPLR